MDITWLTERIAVGGGIWNSENMGKVAREGFNDTSGYLSSAEVYDPTTGTFSPTGSMGTARFAHTATLLNDGRVLITGGSPNGSAALSSSEAYDPTTGTFAATGSLGTARYLHTATLLNNGRVLITGGSPNGSAALNSAEAYDPTTGTFAATGSMGTARDAHTATLLQEGRVLITGGLSSIALSSAEAYDPTTGTFAATGSMGTARGIHSATLLKDGRVLVAGGFGGGGDLNSAELYTAASLTPPNLVSIAISPAAPTLAVGTAQPFVATGTFADSHTEILQSVTWSSSTTTVASITNDATNHGHAYGLALGSTSISACAGSVCNQTSLTVTVSAGADLGISMSSPVGATPAEGTTYAYTIVVTDNGPNPASSVVVSGAMPTNLTVNSVIAGQGTCSGLQTFTCSLGTVAFPGAGVDVTVNVTANTLATPPVGPTMTATATVSTAADDPVPTNNATSMSVTVQRRADLTITGISSPSSVTNGTAFNYSVTAANNGPSTATGIIVSYPLPASVTFNQGASTAGCALSAGTVTCPVVNLTPFSSTVIVINVTPHLAGSLSATFTVSSSQVVDDGPNGGPGANNTPPPFTVTVKANVNLSVTLATTSPVVPVGGSAAFNITVTNNGTDTATGVSFTGSSPTGLSYVGFSSSSAGVSCSAAGQVTCTLPDIPSLGTVSFTIFASAALQGTYVANASVSSSVTDANSADNSASTTVTVTGALGSNLTTLLTDYETSTVQAYSGYPNPAPLCCGLPTQVGANPSNVVIAPNGRLAFTGNVNGSYISVVDLTIQAEIARIRDVGGWSIAITSDGQKLVSVSYNRDELDIIDIATFAVTRISLDGKVLDAAGVNDIHPFSLALVGYQAYIANEFGPVMVVNFANPASPGISTVTGTAALLALHAGHQVAATPDGSTVAVFDRLKTGGSALVYLISTSTNTLSQTVTMTFGGARTIAITRNPNAASGVVAFLGFPGGAIRVLDLRSGSATYGQLLTGSVALGSPVTDMALTPDGNTLQAVNGVFQGSAGPHSTLYTLNAALIVTSPSTALVSTVVIPNSISVRGLAIGYVQNFPLPSAPQVSDVVPQEITNEAPKLVRIFGDNFTAGALVRIGNLDPLPSTFVSPQEVTVTVPAGAAVQVGSIVVTLPNSAAGALAANVSGGGSYGGGEKLRIDPPATFAPSHPVAISGYGVPKLSLLFRDSALLPGGPFSPGIAISPDGLYAYSGLAEVDVTNLDTQQSLSPILGPTSGFGSQTFYDCIGGGDNYAIAPDPTTGKKVLYLVSCDAATESSDTLYFVDVDPSSTTTRNTLLARTIQVPNTDFFSSQGLAVTPDGRYVYSVDARNVSPAVSRLVIFDVLNSTSTIIADITTLGADPTQQHIHVTPDGHSLLLSGTGGASIKVYDIQGANALAPVLVKTITGSGANPPLLYWFQVVGARLFAYASDQRYVEVFNFDRANNNFASIGSYTIPSPPGRFAGAPMAVTPEGTLIYAVLESEDAVAVLEYNPVALSNPISLITKMRTAVNPANVAVSPRGNASADLEAGIFSALPLQVDSTTGLAALNTPFDLSVHVLNNGPSAATGVNMTLAIPAGAVVNSASVISGPLSIVCTITTSQVACPVGTLGTSNSITVDVNVTATSLGTLAFTNTVSGNESDPNPANNAATLNVMVANGADLAITGSVSPNPAVAGSPNTRTWVITNNGPDVASAVTVNFSSTAHSPSTYTSTQGGCTSTPGATICSPGNILPGGQVTITFTSTFVASDASANGTVTITGSVSANTADPNFANNVFVLNLPLTNAATPIEHLFVGDFYTGTLTSVNVSDNAIVASDIPGGVGPNAIAFSPNRHLAFVTNQVDYLTVVDLPTRSELKRIPIVGRAQNAAVTPDGSKLVVPNSNQDKVLIIDTTTFQIVQTINLNGLVGDNAAVTNDIQFGSIVIANNKAYIATTNTSPKLGVIVINLATNAVSVAAGSNLAHGISLLTSTIAALPDGSAVIVPQQGPNQLIRIDTTTDTVTATLPLSFTPDGLVITPSHLGKNGIVGDGGEAPAPETVRSAWYRVRRDVAAALARRAGSASVDVTRSSPIASSPPLVTSPQPLLIPSGAPDGDSDPGPRKFGLAQLRGHPPSAPPPSPPVPEPERIQRSPEEVARIVADMMSGAPKNPFRRDKGD